MHSRSGPKYGGHNNHHTLTDLFTSVQWTLSLQPPSYYVVLHFHSPWCRCGRESLATRSRASYHNGWCAGCITAPDTSASSERTCAPVPDWTHETCSSWSARISSSTAARMWCRRGCGRRSNRTCKRRLPHCPYRSCGAGPRSGFPPAPVDGNAFHCEPSSERHWCRSCGRRHASLVQNCLCRSLWAPHSGRQCDHVEPDVTSQIKTVSH